MGKHASFAASYDRFADTLYISTPEAAERAIEDSFGIWRYGAGDHLVGVTIMDFHEVWQSDADMILHEVSTRLNLPVSLARSLLEKGIAVPSAH